MRNHVSGGAVLVTLILHIALIAPSNTARSDVNAWASAVPVEDTFPPQTLSLRRLAEDDNAARVWNLSSLIQNRTTPSGNAVLRFKYDFEFLSGTNAAALGNVVIVGNSSSSQPPIWHINGFNQSLLSVPPGGTAIIQNVNALDAPLVSPGPQSFLQMDVISLDRGALLVWSGVQVTTTCEMLLEYQMFACALANMTGIKGYKEVVGSAGGTLLVTPGLLRVVSWHSNSVMASNVNVTCSDIGSIGSSSRGSGIVKPGGGTLLPCPCVVGSAATSKELLNGLVELQPLNSQVTMLLTDNMTVLYGTAGVEIYTNVTIRGVPGGRLVELDLGLNLDLFIIAPTDSFASLVLRDIVMVNLAPGPDDQFPASLMVGPLWAVSYDRSVQRPDVLFLTGVTLVVPPDSSAYRSWWANVQASPWPWIRATAAWLTDYIFVSMQISTVDDHTMILNQREGHGTLWMNCTITTHTWRTPSTLASTGITTIVPNDPYAPLTNLVGVNNISQLIQYIQDPPAPYLVLLNNLTVTPEEWPEDLVPVAANVTIIGRPLQTVYLDLGNRVNLISLTRRLSITRVVLLGAAPCNTILSPDPDLNDNSSVVIVSGGCSSLMDSYGCVEGIGTFASMLWGFNFSRPGSFLSVHNVTLLLPTDELAALAMLAQGGTPALSAVVAAELGQVMRSAQVVSISNRSMEVKTLNFITGGQVWQNVILISGTDAGYVPLRAVPDVPLACDITPGANNPSTDNGDHSTTFVGLRGWQVAVIVLSVVLVVSLVGLVSISYRRLHISRTKRLTAKANVEEADSNSNAHVRVHFSSGEMNQVGSTVPSSGRSRTAQMLASVADRGASVDSFQLYLDALEDPFTCTASNTAEPSVYATGEAAFSCNGDANPAGPHDLVTAASAVHAAPTNNDAKASSLSIAQDLASRAGVHLSLAPLPPMSMAGGSSVTAPGSSSMTQPPGSSATTTAPGSSTISRDMSVSRGSDRLPESRDARSMPHSPRDADPLRAFITERTPTTPGCDLNIDYEREIVLHHGPGDVLGVGCFGTVCKGTYNGLPVAVKLINSVWTKRQSLGKEAAELESFRQEVAVLSRCSHRNIVTLFGASLVPPHVCLVEELMECSLEDVIHDKAQPMPLHRVLTLARDIACGLSYLHPTVLHRDLKPANVLLDKSGAAKLVDFGLARLRTSTLVTNHPEVGTCAYMAPECFDERGQGTLKKCDIFSLGVLLWEMLTRTRPWDGLRHIVIAFTVVQGNRLPIPKDASVCPPKMRKVIERCWDADPEKRPEAAALVKLFSIMLQEIGDDLA